MAPHSFSFQVEVQGTASRRVLNADAVGASSTDAMQRVKERIAHHKLSATNISACGEEHATGYGAVLSADWSVSLRDASLDLPDWSPFSWLPDADCLEVKHFDSDGFKAELHRMQNDLPVSCIAVLDGASIPNLSEHLSQHLSH